MAFSSNEFLFVFLPLFLLVQAFLPFRNVSYVLFSLFFYFVGEGWFSAIVVVSVLANYLFGLAIDAQDHAGRRRYVLTGAVVFNLSALFCFKYAAFFLANVPGAEAQAHAAAQWHLPLGISFLTFHAVSYLVDIYRRDARAERSLINLSLYMLMFPQLIAGPILRFHTIAHQLTRRIVSARHVYYGFLLFSVGLGQKVLLADTLAKVVDPAFTRAQTLSCPAAWLAVIAYALQIFFDFCGYSNMAMGLGWLTGFDLPRNFDYPYSSQSITEFWRRWHMSLSRWFRDYLYVPLGGNRQGLHRTYLNLLIVFLLCGLWHGAAWTFVLWGAYHGAWLVIERLGLGPLIARAPRLVRHCYAMLIVLLGWVLFRADDLTQAQSMFRALFSRRDMSMTTPLMSREETVVLVIALTLSVPTLPWLSSRWRWLASEAPLPKRVAPLSYVLGSITGSIVFIAAATKVLTGAYSPFIYFRF